jgi:heterodisulfide reductase subunit C
MMHSSPHVQSTPAASGQTLAQRIAQTTGSSVLDCYQCGRCAAGCPQNVDGEMDLSPTRIMRLLQLESAFADEPERAAEYARQALGADTPWLCAGCLACTTRCPQEVDIAGTMDVLRQEALKRGLASTSKRARDVQVLHQAFLSGALKRGRIHELSLMLRYKLRSGHLLQDALLAPAMFARGKLHILPDKSTPTDCVNAAIDELKRQEGGDGA